MFNNEQMVQEEKEVIGKEGRKVILFTTNIQAVCILYFPSYNSYNNRSAVGFVPMQKCWNRNSKKMSVLPGATLLGMEELRKEE